MSMIAVVHEGDIITVERKSRGYRFGEDLNCLVPINNLGELRWYAGCHYSRDRSNGLLAISQKVFTDTLVEKYGVVSGEKNPGWTCEKFDSVNEGDEPGGDWR